MANRHPSAVKRNRQNEKRRARNRIVVAKVRTVVRKARETVASKDPVAAQAVLREVTRALTKAGSKGVLHKNAVARRVSRLSKQVAALSKAG